MNTNEWITDRLPTTEDAQFRDEIVWVMSTTIAGKDVVFVCAWYNVKKGQPWQPITVPVPYEAEPYVKGNRWSVYYCYNELKWCLQDGDEKHKTYFPTMTTNDVNSLAKMQRLADAYQEVMP